jgi:hypothetical protein
MLVYLFIIRYRQCFDLEGESGIVVRAIGTIAYLGRLSPSPTIAPMALGSEELPSPQLTPTESDEWRYCLTLESQTP